TAHAVLERKRDILPAAELGILALELEILAIHAEDRAETRNPVLEREQRGANFKQRGRGDVRDLCPCGVEDGGLGPAEKGDGDGEDSTDGDGGAYGERPPATRRPHAKPRHSLRPHKYPTNVS